MCVIITLFPNSRVPIKTTWVIADRVSAHYKTRIYWRVPQGPRCRNKFSA